MEFKIERLKSGDSKTFHEMLALFGEVFEDPVSYGSAPPGDAYIDHLLRDPTFTALIARAGSAVIGALTAYELRKFEQARSEIYLYDLAVRAPYRRRGVATQLIAELRSIAAACGAYVVFVQADLGDDPAIALYQKLGRREEVLHFDIDP